MSSSYPEMKLAMLVIHCDKVMKDNDASQINLPTFTTHAAVILSASEGSPFYQTNFFSEKGYGRI